MIKTSTTNNNIIAKYYIDNNFNIRWDKLEENINSLLDIKTNNTFIKNNVTLENVNVPMIRKINIEDFRKRHHSFYIGFDITQDKYSFVFCISPKDINKTKLDTVPELIKIISDNI